MDYNTNSNSSNMNYHKLIPVSIEEARNWYKGDDNVLKTLALRAFSEKELRHSFRDIKSFKDACDVLELNHVLKQRLKLFMLGLCCFHPSH